MAGHIIVEMDVLDKATGLRQKYRGTKSGWITVQHFFFEGRLGRWWGSGWRRYQRLQALKYDIDRRDVIRQFRHWASAIRQRARPGVEIKIKVYRRIR